MVNRLCQLHSRINSMLGIHLPYDVLARNASSTKMCKLFAILKIACILASQYFSFSVRLDGSAIDYICVGEAPDFLTLGTQAIITCTAIFVSSFVCLKRWEKLLNYVYGRIFRKQMIKKALTIYFFNYFFVLGILMEEAVVLSISIGWDFIKYEAVDYFEMCYTHLLVCMYISICYTI